ncbi:MFS transporter [Phyllobacterium phragmitis]|uniref:MFS transporter n=1 Tax=Phyllobacterium phragmitis TaxID=2670329 RepID=A0A2S9IMD0_9HYPH|nr:MFS transporter [Phyllobacterium phragmitis]PRD41684.1 MFS transporter [Phyllobacterium phragmitis]
MAGNITNRNTLALAAVCLSALMVGLEISSIPAILPTLEHVLPADFQQLQWIMNAYTIAMTACLMASGALADRFGRKRVFMAGVVFGISSLACGLATNAPILIAARVVQGIGGAALLACQIAVLSHQFRDSPDRGMAFSSWGIVFGAGLGFGPLIGGVTVAFISWEWVFLAHVPLAVVALLLARFAIAESSDPNAIRIDIAGIVMLSLAVFCLVYLITRGRALRLDDLVGLGVAVLGAASFFVFVIVEMKVPRPMFDFGTLRIPTFSGALLGAAGMNSSFWPFVIYLPIWFQAGLGYDSVTAGFALLAYTLPTLVAPPFGERMLSRHGPVIVLPLGLFVIGAGFLLMRLGAMSEFPGWLTMLPGCVLAGTGVGLMNTPVANTATASVPADRAGMGSGMDMSVRMIALAINIALMGFILLRGIRASLVESGQESDAAHALGETIAAGNLLAAEASGIAKPVAEQALAQGVGWVMLYALVCAWSLSILSFAVLRQKHFAHAR